MFELFFVLACLGLLGLVLAAGDLLITLFLFCIYKMDGGKKNIVQYFKKMS